MAHVDSFTMGAEEARRVVKALQVIGPVMFVRLTNACIVGSICRPGTTSVGWWFLCI